MQNTNSLTNLLLTSLRKAHAKQPLILKLLTKIVAVYLFLLLWIFIFAWNLLKQSDEWIVLLLIFQVMVKKLW